MAEKIMDKTHSFIFSCNAKADGKEYVKGQIYELTELDWQNVKHSCQLVKGE